MKIASAAVCLLVLCAATQAAEPRLQWEGKGVRVLSIYDGKWRLERDGKVSTYRETERTPTRIVLADKAASQLILSANTATLGNTTIPGTWTASTTDDDLGYLSEKYESSGRGPGTISTGIGDPGGVSYGSYQLASKVGRADQFVKAHYPKEFAGLKGGTPEFSAVWTKLAQTEPAQMHQREHQFIRETHFDPQVKKVAKDLGLDVRKRSRVFQDAVWSTAVHHGPSTDAITKSLAAFVKASKPETFNEPAALKLVYAERGRTDTEGNLVRFKKVSASWIPALKKRFENELKDALKALETE